MHMICFVLLLCRNSERIHAICLLILCRVPKLAIRFLFSSEIVPEKINEVDGYQTTPGPCFNIKTVFPMYGDSHVKSKPVSRPSYL